MADRTSARALYHGPGSGPVSGTRALKKDDIFAFFSALAEINQAVNTVDQGTQQNAAMVEEQTAASHSLAREAAALFELLGQFRFEDMARSSASARSGFEQQSAPVSSHRSAPRPLAARGSAAVAVKHEEWQDF